MSDPGPSWPSCLNVCHIILCLYSFYSIFGGPFRLDFCFVRKRDNAGNFLFAGDIFIEINSHNLTMMVFNKNTH